MHVLLKRSLSCYLCTSPREGPFGVTQVCGRGPGAALSPVCLPWKRVWSIWTAPLAMRPRPQLWEVGVGGHISPPEGDLFCWDSTPPEMRTLTKLIFYFSQRPTVPILPKIKLLRGHGRLFHRWEGFATPRERKPWVETPLAKALGTHAFPHAQKAGGPPGFSETEKIWVCRDNCVCHSSVTESCHLPLVPRKIHSVRMGP